MILQSYASCVKWRHNCLWKALDQSWTSPKTPLIIFHLFLISAHLNGPLDKHNGCFLANNLLQISSVLPFYGHPVTINTSTKQITSQLITDQNDIVVVVLSEFDKPSCVHVPVCMKRVLCSKKLIQGMVGVWNSTTGELQIKTVINLAMPSKFSKINEVVRPFRRSGRTFWFYQFITFSLL